MISQAQYMLVALMGWMRSRVENDKGATAVEYGLMVSLIALAIVVIVTTLGTTLSAKFCDVVNGIGGSC